MAAAATTTRNSQRLFTHTHTQIFYGGMRRKKNTLNKGKTIFSRIIHARVYIRSYMYRLLLNLHQMLVIIYFATRIFSYTQCTNICVVYIVAFFYVRSKSSRVSIYMYTIYIYDGRRTFIVFCVLSCGMSAKYILWRIYKLCLYALYLVL